MALHEELDEFGVVAGMVPSSEAVMAVLGYHDGNLPEISSMK